MLPVSRDFVIYGYLSPLHCVRLPIAKKIAVDVEMAGYQYGDDLRIDHGAPSHQLRGFIHIIFMMLGASTRCEVATSGGRVDMVARTPWRVYVFEFKLDTPAEEAMRQISDKGYALQWEARGRVVTKIGVNFSTRLRTIDSWCIDS